MQTGGPAEVAGSGGGGRLQSTSNSVIPNSLCSYGYDALGRTFNRSINGSTNATNWNFDAISRITSESNALGTFGYQYVNDTTGSSYGDPRLASIAYPNGQTTKFSYLPTGLDERLQQIQNLTPSSTLLSQFNYAFDSAGQIRQWQQQQNSTNVHQSLGYDFASQLTSASNDSGSSFKTYITSSPSVPETFSITAYDASLTGTTPAGQETASYSASAGATPATIASNLAASINSTMSNIGVTASASGSSIGINTSALDATSFSAGNGTSINISSTAVYPISALVGGAPSSGDIVSVTVYSSALTGTTPPGQETASYTVASTDTPSAIASNLATNINASMSNIGVSATAQGALISIVGPPSTFSGSSSGTETVTLTADLPTVYTLSIGGTVSAGDVVSITGFSPILTGTTPVGQETASYTVLSGDTTSDIASGLATSVSVR